MNIERGGQRYEFSIPFREARTRCGYPFIYCLGCVCHCNRGSLYFSEIKDFLPCDLCWFQRIFMYPLTILLGIAYFKDDVGITKYVLPLSFIGGGISLYHVTIQRIFSATGNAVACGKVPCYTDYLNWFGFITIPRWRWSHLSSLLSCCGELAKHLNLLFKHFS